jgi:UDP-2,3-diacylglucosamine hydrolase
MPIERLVVVSDAHLGTAPPAAEAALLRFLAQVHTLGDGLLLNGDLFGFWFSYRRAIPRAGVRVMARLAELAGRLPVFMTGGNHDRWGEDAGAASFWESELGIRYAPRELRLALGGATLLAHHGDGLAEPGAWPALKNRLIASPVVSAGFRALPAELGFWLARKLEGNLERTPAGEQREALAAARQQDWALTRLRAESDIGILVMGHTHRPVALELLPGRYYLNPGAWFEGWRYGIATADCVELRQFPG